ncbi:unnamed protein product [Cuscuta campestris]|uniref:Uncharacterized protein n=1 Tax=Cuscuta campestris TaxID=132261 RepID=A0A484L2I6_9ASTE|nr:unnamed protein product [Cuscuta campestris]
MARVPSLLPVACRWLTLSKKAAGVAARPDRTCRRTLAGVLTDHGRPCLAKSESGPRGTGRRFAGLTR